MFEALVDRKTRKVDVLSVNKWTITVAYLKGAIRHVCTIPYRYFSWKSDNWYEVSRTIKE